MAVPDGFQKMLKPVRVRTAASSSVAIDPFLRGRRKPVALRVGYIQRLARKAHIEFGQLRFGVGHIIEVTAPSVIFERCIGTARDGVGPIA